ncbi:MAG TPA: hypothetical protein PKC43_08295 [Phycisphaerales bacterium]|nr:hypothetical protein [Phycisphaerales bacterium]HMP37436.1 hypothetical protein [Phycisphaerales bacterium]
MIPFACLISIAVIVLTVILTARSTARVGRPMNVRRVVCIAGGVQLLLILPAATVFHYFDHWVNPRSDWHDIAGFGVGMSLCALTPFVAGIMWVTARLVNTRTRELYPTACPHCGYPLDVAGSARCPECGGVSWDRPP